MSHGPNVTKLILRFVARESVPPGAGLNAVHKFFTNPEHRKRIVKTAETKAIEAIRLIKAAPDNPYGDDEEIIAGALLKKIKEQKP